MHDLRYHSSLLKKPLKQVLWSGQRGSGPYLCHVYSVENHLAVKFKSLNSLGTCDTNYPGRLKTQLLDDINCKLFKVNYVFIGYRYGL